LLDLPPVHFAATLLAMTALHNLLPLAYWLEGPLRWLGVPLGFAGYVLVVRSRGLFAQRGTTIRPFQQSSELVTDGFFRWSRNPMYSGLVLTVLGLAFLLGSAVAFAAVPLFWALLLLRFVRHEERWLEERFGEQYCAYKQRVRRWL
jgi:protein-S-isoprenylcysteine O-methyltransferase Ste14